MEAIAIRERPLIFSGPMVKAILAGRKTQTRRLVRWQPLAEGLDLSFSGLSVGHYCTDVPASGHVLYSRDGSGVWHQRTKPAHCPHGKEGDRIWVRETWRTEELHGDHTDGVRFAADGAFMPIENSHKAVESWIVAHDNGQHGERWRSSRNMSRWASRIHLQITGLRVERLQWITEEDAAAEGIEISRRATAPGEELRPCVHCGKHRVEHLGAARCCPGLSSGYDTRTLRGGFVHLWDLLADRRADRNWASNPWVWVITFQRTEHAS